MTDDASDWLGPDLTALLAQAGELSTSEWMRAVDEYVQRTEHPNALFNRIASPWVIEPTLAMSAGRQQFQATLGRVEAWDARHAPERRHKGTPYYWMGMFMIIAGDLDRGFLYMHQAYREDQLSSGEDEPDQPAMAFVTLDASTQQQAFRPEVTRYATFLETRLSRYQAQSGGSLTLENLRTKLRQDPDLIDAMFHLVYATARAVRMSHWGKQPTTTPFGTNLAGQALGDLCLVTEQLLRHGWGDGLFFHLSVRYLGKTGFPKVADGYLQQVSKASKTPGQWANTVEALIDGVFPIGGQALPPRVSDVAIAYLIRNHVDHSVTADALIASRREDIEERVFRAIFGIVEHLP